MKNPLFIELEKNYKPENYNDAITARDFLQAIRKQASAVDTLNKEYIQSLKQTDKFSNYLENLTFKINTYASDINVAKIQADVTINEKKRTRFYQLKKRRQLQARIDEINEHIADMEKQLPKHQKNLDACQKPHVMAAFKKKNQTKKKNLLTGISTLYILIQEYRNLRKDYKEKYNVELPTINLSEIISRTNEFNISVSLDEIPTIGIFLPEDSSYAKYFEVEELCTIESSSDIEAI